MSSLTFCASGFRFRPVGRLNVPCIGLVPQDRNALTALARAIAAEMPTYYTVTVDTYHGNLRLKVAIDGADTVTFNIDLPRDQIRSTLAILNARCVGFVLDDPNNMQIFHLQTWQCEAILSEAGSMLRATHGATVQRSA